MHLAKKPAIRRMWTIDRELRAKRFPTVDQLAQQLEVDAKTIRRDLSTMELDFQAPVRFNHRRNGWEYSCDTYRLPAVVITEGELVAMFLAGQALQQAIGTPYEAELQRAIQKLKEFLPDEVSLHWQTLDQAQSFRQSVLNFQDVEIFRRLADAAVHHRRLTMRYWTASRNAESVRQVDPYHLACVDGAWYLIGWCHQREETRTFSANRIREVSETGEDFEPPKDFHIGDHFDGAFKVIASNGAPLQLVQLKFAPSAARFIREKLWHKSQQCEVHSDESVTLTLALRSLIEIKRFALSWGSECLVISPSELREEILQEAEKMIAQTRPSAPLAPQANVTVLEKMRDDLKKQPRRKKRTG